MSTKIYNGWRCSVKDFYESYLPDFTNHCLTTVCAVVKDQMERVDAISLAEKIYNENGWAKENKVTFEDFYRERRDSLKLRQVFERAKEASLSPSRSDQCYDCSLNVWFYKNKAYIIPYGESWIVSKGWNDSAKVEEKYENYSYWNNTDQPEGITDRQWDTRKKNWDAVCLNDWDKLRLTKEIINAKTNIGLNEIARILLPMETENQKWINGNVAYVSDKSIMSEHNQLVEYFQKLTDSEVKTKMLEIAYKAQNKMSCAYRG